MLAEARSSQVGWRVDGVDSREMPPTREHRPDCPQSPNFLEPNCPGCKELQKQKAAQQDCEQREYERRHPVDEQREARSDRRFVAGFCFVAFFVALYGIVKFIKWAWNN